MICHYCQQKITKGQPRKTKRSRMVNVETGKSYPFLGDFHFHIACFDHLLSDRKMLAERAVLKGYKVIL